MRKSPLSIVKEQHGEKQKLVAALEPFTKDGDLWVDRTNEKKGLGRVSNAKLIRLLRVFTEVKGKFGTRAKLIDAVLEAQKRTKDAGMRHRLEAYPVPRLYDLYRSLHKEERAAKQSASSVASSKSSGAGAVAGKRERAGGEGTATASTGRRASETPKASAGAKSTAASRSAKPAAGKSPASKSSAAPKKRTSKA